jgi:hypothetical protein
MPRNALALCYHKPKRFEMLYGGARGKDRDRKRKKRRVGRAGNCCWAIRAFLPSLDLWLWVITSTMADTTTGEILTQTFCNIVLQKDFRLACRRFGP